MKLAATKLSRQVNTKALLKNHNGQPVNGSSPKIQIKSILIAQPKPENDKNPYTDLARKHKLTIDFKPFIHLEGVSTREFSYENCYCVYTIFCTICNCKYAQGSSFETSSLF